MDLEAKLQKFQNIAHEEQIKICSKILSVAVKKWNTRAIPLLNTVQSWSVTSEKLDMVYLNFLKAHNKTQRQRKATELWKYEHGQQYIKTLRQDEKEERKEEEKILDGRMGELLKEEKKIEKKQDKKNIKLWKWVLVLFLIAILVLSFFYRDILINYIQLWLSKWMSLWNKI